MAGMRIIIRKDGKETIIEIDENEKLPQREEIDQPDFEIIEKSTAKPKRKQYYIPVDERRRKARISLSPTQEALKEIEDEGKDEDEL